MRRDDDVDAVLKRRKMREMVIEYPEASDEEILNLYSHARVFMFPSRIEGFGISPLEAMSFGVPVVGSDIPVVREENAAGGDDSHASRQRKEKGFLEPPGGFTFQYSAMGERYADHHVYRVQEGPCDRAANPSVCVRKEYGCGQKDADEKEIDGDPDTGPSVRQLKGIGKVHQSVEGGSYRQCGHDGGSGRRDFRVPRPQEKQFPGEKKRQSTPSAAQESP